MSNLILCVDDSLTMQTVAEITFRSSDFTYVGARNADEARTANADSPALILVDNNLPDGSGYDLAQELKSTNADAIVLMLCGNSEAYDEGKGAAAGCEGHVVKPWQTDKIVEQLKSLSDAGPSAAAPAASAAPAKAVLPKPVEPPRSATLMGMPALEMPPSKPLPAGVAALKPSKLAVPSLTAKAPVKTPPPPVKSAPPPVAAAEPSGHRAPMIAKSPGKPIRLVLASQAEAAAHSGAVASGMSSEDATAFGNVSRELLEQIIWEVVPDLAESIIRDNLDTLTAKAR